MLAPDAGTLEIMSMSSVEQLKVLLATYEELQAKSEFDDLSDLKTDASAFANRLVDAVYRIGPHGSAYAQQAAAAIKAGVSVGLMTKYVGWAKGLLADIEAGFIDA